MTSEPYIIMMISLKRATSSCSKTINGVFCVMIINLMPSFNSAEGQKAAYCNFCIFNLNETRTINNISKPMHDNDDH